MDCKQTTFKTGMQTPMISDEKSNSFLTNINSNLQRLKLKLTCVIKRIMNIFGKFSYKTTS